VAATARPSRLHRHTNPPVPVAEVAGMARSYKTTIPPGSGVRRECSRSLAGRGQDSRQPRLQNNQNPMIAR